METNRFRLSARTEDDAVSPVVGTILMVAVTVALGATVLAIMSGIGTDEVKENANAVFQATAVDTDGNGKKDAIRVTYISGPAGLVTADGDVSVQWSGGATPAHATWSPGDFVSWDGSAGANVVTVSVLGTTVVDQTITLDE